MCCTYWIYLSVIAGTPGQHWGMVGEKGMFSCLMFREVDLNCQLCLTDVLLYLRVDIIGLNDISEKSLFQFVGMQQWDFMPVYGSVSV